MNDDCIFQVYETNQSIEHDSICGWIFNTSTITIKQTIHNSLHVSKAVIVFDNFPIVLESIYSIKWIDWNFYDIK